MSLKFRLWLYAAMITAYLLFLVLGGTRDAWQFAIILAVCIAAAEYFTQWSIKKRDK